jgi:hypothetical protein
VAVEIFQIKNDPTNVSYIHLFYWCQLSDSIRKLQTLNRCLSARYPWKLSTRLRVWRIDKKEKLLSDVRCPVWWKVKNKCFSTLPVQHFDTKLKQGCNHRSKWWLLLGVFAKCKNRLLVSSSLSVCVCVRACARARACVCVYVRTYVRME